MEKISASNLDESQGFEHGKEGAVEHLREMRDVLTPFIQKYIEQFADFESVEIPPINSPEILTERQYTFLFFKLFEENSVSAVYTNLNQIMVECIGSGDMYSLLSKVPSVARYYGATSVEELMEKLRESYERFVVRLNSVNGLQDALLLMGEEKRLVLSKRATYVSRNAEPFLLREFTENYRPTDDRIHDYAVVKKAEKVMYGFPLGNSSEEKEEDLQVFPHVVALPVSEYGQDVTLKIYTAMQTMYSKVAPLKEEAKRMVEAHQKMFETTARGRDFTVEEKDSIEEHIKKAEKRYFAGIFALQEGVATLAQVLAICTAKKVEGFETGEELLKALVEQGLPNKAGHLLSPGIIGPLSLSGCIIEDIIQVHDGGRLTLNKGITEYSSNLKDHISEKQLWKEQGLPSAGMGCPVAYKGKDIKVSGISMLSDAFLKIFEGIK